MADGTCSVDGCGRTGRVILGWCVGHYTRWSRAGDLGSPRIAPARVKIPPGTLCSVDTCDRRAHCRTWCKSHHSRWERHGDVQAGVPIDLPVTKRPPRPCSVPDCGRRHTARGYCGPHYQRFIQTGNPLSGGPIAASAAFPRGCDVGDCPESHYSLGFCVRHHYRLKRYGDPLGGKYFYSDLVRETRLLPPVERFWSRVNKNGSIPEKRPELGPCWVWMASKHEQGYGQTFLFPDVAVGAHRVAWYLSGRDFVTGFELDHLCENPSCVCPDHLQQVPPVVNIMRGNSAPARNARRTRCGQGHEFTPRNTKLTRHGHRRCRICVNDKPLRLGAERRLTKAERAVATAYRLAITGDPCRYCGGPSEENDHFFPLVKGGSAHWVNLTRACVRCNRSKGSHCGTWFLLHTQRLATVALST